MQADGPAEEKEMKEKELREVMNEVVGEIYFNAYCNLLSSKDFYEDYVKSGFNDKTDFSIANDYYTRACEDLTLICRLTGRNIKDELGKMPYPMSNEEITEWWTGGEQDVA